MTNSQEREHHAANPTDRRPNTFDKDTIYVGDKDYYSKWRSVYAQVDHQIAERNRIAREEEKKKREAKKTKKGAVNG